MTMAYPGKPVRSGDTGPIVEAVQKQLNLLKITEIGGLKPLVVDGEFGPSTETGVRLFQAQSVDKSGNPLDIDGVIGPMSWAALFGTAVKTVKPAAASLLGKLVEIATAEVGVLESPLGTNRGPRVDQYLTRVGLPLGGNFAWCAAFTYFCFDEAAKAAGLPDNPSPKTAGVIDLWNKSGAKGLFRVSPKQAAQNPQVVTPGMLFFLDTGSGTGHVGIVKSVTGNLLRTIEGNTTDKTGSREGIGVFERNKRTIASINLGFADFSRKF